MPLERFKKIILTSFLAVALQATGANAYDKTLTVVYTDWYPYTYQDAGEAKGFEIEIFRLLMGKMNIGVKFQNLPWKRCLKVMEERNADAVVSLLKTPEREEFVYFPQENISISRSCLFTKVDTHIDFNGYLETLSPYTIGVIAGFSYGNAFDRAACLQKDEARNAEMLIKKVISGRNTLGAENKAVLIAVARRLDVQDQIRFLEPPIHAQNLYVGFGKTCRLKELADEFSVSLSEFKKTDDYTRMLERYGISRSEMTGD